MGEQKNLFLAIGLSIAIIVIFQLLFPQQALVDKPINKEANQEIIEPSSSIDDNQSTDLISDTQELIQTIHPTLMEYAQCLMPKGLIGYISVS